MIESVLVNPRAHDLDPEIAASAVRVFERAGRKERGAIAMQGDAAPIGILVAPDQRHAFIANTRSNLVTLIDVEEMTVKNTLRGGNTPDGMALAVE